MWAITRCSAIHWFVRMVKKMQCSPRPKKQTTNVVLKRKDWQRRSSSVLVKISRSKWWRTLRMPTRSARTSFLRRLQGRITSWCTIVVCVGVAFLLAVVNPMVICLSYRRILLAVRVRAVQEVVLLDPLLALTASCILTLFVFVATVLAIMPMAVPSSYFKAVTVTKCLRTCLMVHLSPSSSVV